MSDCDSTRSLTVNRHFFTLPSENWDDRQCWGTLGTEEYHAIMGHLACAALPCECGPSQFSDQVAFISTFTRGDHVGWKGGQMLEIIWVVLHSFPISVACLYWQCDLYVRRCGKVAGPPSETPRCLLHTYSRTLTSRCTRVLSGAGDRGCRGDRCGGHTHLSSQQVQTLM